MLKCLLCIGVCSLGFAEDSSLSLDPSSDVSWGKKDVHVEKEASLVEGIAFLGNWDLVRRNPSEFVGGTSSKGVYFLDDNQSFLQDVADAYIGAPLTKQVLNALQQDVADVYRENGQPFAVISIAKHGMKDGIIQIVVEEAKLGEIRAEGNRYFSGTSLMKYVKTPSGAPIVMKDIWQDVAWMNQNPFRRTDILFVPGKQPGTADLELVTTDRWPYRVYAGSDNTGTISTERNRIFCGFDFGKTILPDSQVAYQFSCSPNWNRFYAHTLSTRIPCPWRHVVILYGGYSQVKPSLEEASESELSTGWQVDGRYRIPLMCDASLMQEFVFGYDFKETATRIKEHGHKEFQATADINQFMIGYELGYSTKNLKTTFVAEVFGNPGSITKKNQTSDYQEFRKNAKAQYGYLKIVHSLSKKTSSGCSFSYDISGQAASTNLLPSEQFTLTGYGAVRGFEERILNVDNAALLNLTLELPHWSPTKTFSRKKIPHDDLYVLAFFDCGVGANHKHPTIKTLGSVGPGIRYQFSRYIMGRLDYGFQLWHKGFDVVSHSRYNFGLIVSY